MEGAFFLFVILTAIGSLASEYVKSVNHVGEHYSDKMIANNLED